MTTASGLEETKEKTFTEEKTFFVFCMVVYVTKRNTLGFKANVDKIF